MDVVAAWTLKIAERVAPDETDFAAEMGQAYASGGKARAALFHRPGAEPGGFGLTAAIGDLPVILRALADSAEGLQRLFASRELGNTVAILTLAAAMRQRKSGARKPDEGNEPESKQDDEKPILEESPTEHPDGTNPNPTSAQEGGDAAPATEALDAAARQLRERLQDGGMPRSQAEPTAYEVLAELLSDPESAQEFLRGLRGEPRE